MLENLRTHWSSLGMGDLFSLLCVFTLMLITIGCNVLFTNFIESKPSGRKTVIGRIAQEYEGKLPPVSISARVNLATSQVSTICNIILHLGIVARIVLGPFPIYCVVAYHYAVRVTSVSFLIMLTINRIISILFILDFQKMTAILERNVMICVGVVTSICTMACILQEVIVRNSRGLNHFARLDHFIWLGKVL